MPLPNSLREVSHPQVSRRKVARQSMLKRSGFVKLPVYLSDGFDHANVRLKSGRVFPVGNRYGKLILHEEIETEKAHSLLTFRSEERRVGKRVEILGSRKRR